MVAEAEIEIQEAEAETETQEVVQTVAQEEHLIEIKNITN